MKTYFKSWDLMRVLRMGLGLFVVVQGFRIGDQMLLLLGGLFSLMPLFNIGCCATNACSNSTSNNKDNATKDISYEEVK